MALDAYAKKEDGTSWECGQHMNPLDEGIRAIWREAFKKYLRQRGHVLSAEEIARPGRSYMESGLLHGHACDILSVAVGEPVLRDYNLGWLYWTSECVQRLHGAANWSRAEQLARDEQFLLDHWIARRCRVDEKTVRNAREELALPEREIVTFKHPRSKKEARMKLHSAESPHYEPPAWLQKARTDWDEAEALKREIAQRQRQDMVDAVLRAMREQEGPLRFEKPDGVVRKVAKYLLQEGRIKPTKTKDKFSFELNETRDDPEE